LGCYIRMQYISESRSVKAGLMADAVALIRKEVAAPSIREVLENISDINDGSSGRTNKPEGAMTTWPIQEAQKQFSELMDKVLAEGPQVITRGVHPKFAAKLAWYFFGSTC